MYLFMLETRNARIRFVLEALVAAFFVLLLAKIGSALYDNPRPYVVAHIRPYFPASTDNGFPSDHTLLSGYLAILLWYQNKRWGWPLLAIALIVGLARVAGKAHHLVDIAGALVFAAVGVTVGVLLVRAAIRRWRPQLLTD